MLSLIRDWFFRPCVRTHIRGITLAAHGSGAQLTKRTNSGGLGAGPHQMTRQKKQKKNNLANLMKTMPVELLLLPVSLFQAALLINVTLTQRRLLSNLS